MQAPANPADMTFLEHLEELRWTIVRSAIAVAVELNIPDAAVQQGSLLASMPGSVIRLGAALGDTVSAGQPLVWLEAMKMEHTITAPADGLLTQLDVAVGQQVEVGTVLARVERAVEGE